MGRVCGFCGKSLEGRHKNTKYCDPKCRMNAFDERKRGGNVVELRQEEPALEGVVLQPGPLEMGDVERTTVRDLETAGKLDTPVGAICVTLARRLDRPRGDTGSALQSVAGRLEEMLAKATRGLVGKTAPDLLEDELAARRNGRGA